MNEEESKTTEEDLDLQGDYGEQTFYGFRLASWIPSGTWRDVWIGQYDYSYLFMERGGHRVAAGQFGDKGGFGQEAPLSCVPRWPFCKGKKYIPKALPPFFANDEPLPILLAVLMGFQHAVAMVVGLIIPTLILASSNPDKGLTSYLISMNYLVSGVGTILHVLRIPIPFTQMFYGTGLISVMGVSFTHVGAAFSTILTLTGQGHSWAYAYGAYMGTVLVASAIFTVLVFVLPVRFLKALFPTWVAGLVVVVLGISLLESGFQNWGGGASCVDGVSLCSGNGDVELVFGSPAYIGIGFIGYVSLIAIDLFGSPFFRNGQVIFSFLFAYFIAAVVKYDGKSFLNKAEIDAAPNSNFFWLKSVPLGFYAPALLPCLIAIFTDAAATVGDITALEEASLLNTGGEKHDATVKGGLLAQSGNEFLGALVFCMPITVYAQNIGIVSFTFCASKVAGVVTGLWLIFMGLVGKVGATFANAPNCVIGPISTFLFGSIVISGVKILLDEGRLSRRKRFILCLAASLGIGTILQPNWSQTNLWPTSPTMTSLESTIRQTVLDILFNGFTVSWLVAIILNAVLPQYHDPDQILREQLEQSLQASARIEAEMNATLTQELTHNLPISILEIGTDGGFEMHDMPAQDMVMEEINME